MFFPERGGSTVKAKAICKECKVREECLEFAVERKERFGIWGGKSERRDGLFDGTRQRKKKAKIPVWYWECSFLDDEPMLVGPFTNMKCFIG